MKALKSGGLIYFETFLKTESCQENPDRYLEPGELCAIFKEYRIIHYSETLLPATDTWAERGMAQLVARRNDID